MENGIQHIPTKTSWTLSDLDAAIRGDLGSQPNGGMTLRELCESTGYCCDAISARLRKLKGLGKLTIGHELREGLDGQPHRVPVYYIRA